MNIATDHEAEVERLARDIGRCADGLSIAARSVRGRRHRVALDALAAARRVRSPDRADRARARAREQAEVDGESRRSAWRMSADRPPAPPQRHV